jgi:glycosyltransferase involved in cell wall biosynthesis
MSNSDRALVEATSDSSTVLAETIRVAHVVVSLDIGGLERIVADLVRVGRALGQNPSVICLEGLGTLAPQVEAMGVPLLCADKRPGLRLETIGRFRLLLRQLNPDVVHTHQIGALIYAGPAARRERVPVVVHTEHTNNSVRHRSLNRQFRTRLLWGLAGSYAARFFCVSDDIADAARAYRTVPRRKVVVVPNGIDTAAFASQVDCESLRQDLGIPHGVPVIGTVGRLDEIKRQDLLIRSFAEVLNHHPKSHLLLIGDGPERNPLQQLTEKLGIAECVHFAGYQPRPERFLHLMDVFALTSRHEGMPLAILEAWAAGLPVVASRVGGIPKMITQGQTGVLFESGDEASLSMEMSRLIAHPEEARRLGDAGRNLATSRYDLRVMAQTYGHHYRDLLHNPGTLTHSAGMGR